MCCSGVGNETLRFKIPDRGENPALTDHDLFERLRDPRSAGVSERGRQVRKRRVRTVFDLTVV